MRNLGKLIFGQIQLANQTDTLGSCNLQIAQPNYNYKMQQEATSTPAAKRPKPSDTLFMKALSAIQSAHPQALPSPPIATSTLRTIAL